MREKDVVWGSLSAAIYGKACVGGAEREGERELVWALSAAIGGKVCRDKYANALCHPSPPILSYALALPLSSSKSLRRMCVCERERERVRARAIFCDFSQSVCA